MRLQGKRLAELGDNFYENLELWYPFLRFKEEGAEVIPVGSGNKKSIQGMNPYYLSSLSPENET